MPGLADNEYIVSFSIFTFISRWRSKNFLRWKFKFHISALADHEYIICFSICVPSSWGGGPKNFFGEKLNFTSLGSQITYISFVSWSYLGGRVKNFFGAKLNFGFSGSLITTILFFVSWSGKKFFRSKLISNYTSYYEGLDPPLANSRQHPIKIRP